jgi:hypothetical protein
MKKQLHQIIKKTNVKPELFPIDFFYSDLIQDDKKNDAHPAEIYIERYNQKFSKVKNSHRPISKLLNGNLIIKNI